MAKENKQKNVYLFGDKFADGKADMKNLLGGKGANLAEMSLIGVPVPPGFTITTEMCTEYNLHGRDGVIKLIKKEVEEGIILDIGKGNKILQIPGSRVVTREEFLIDITIVSVILTISLL